MGRFRMGLAALVVTSLPLAGCGSSAGSGATTAPFANRSATVSLQILRAPNAVLALVPVTINGKGPFDFALDTGASTSFIDTSVAHQVGLDLTSSTQSIIGVVCTTTARRAKVSTWKAGSVALPATTVAVSRLPGATKANGGFQGLLGSDVLHQFGSIAVDYTSGQLRLGGAVHASPSEQRLALKVVSDKGSTIALVPVTIAGKGPFTFALDTGAVTSVLDIGVARTLSLALTSSQKGVSGVACSTGAVRHATITRWSAGPLTLPPTTAVVIKMAGDKLKGLLGSNVLAGFGTVVVDYRDAELVVPARQRTADGGPVITLRTAVR